MIDNRKIAYVTAAWRHRHGHLAASLQVRFKVIAGCGRIAPQDRWLAEMHAQATRCTRRRATSRTGIRPGPPSRRCGEHGPRTC